jgi:thioredoxin reductase (NADPH)
VASTVSPAAATTIFLLALTLANFASEVLVVHRSDRPTAQEIYIQGVSQHGAVRLRDNTVVEEILGDQVVNGIRVRDMSTGAMAALETAAIFIYIGLEPNTGFLQGLLRLDDGGRIPTDIWMRTALPGLFAAGDVRCDSASQAITAALRGPATRAMLRQALVANCSWS